MAEPITGMAALGLCCNIIELVNFSCKIIAKGNELARSASGELDSSSYLRTSAADLVSLNTRVTQSLHDADAKENGFDDDDDDEDERALRVVGGKCSEEAYNLIDCLDRLIPGDRSSRFRNVYYAFKAYRKEGVLAVIEKRMRGYQDQVNNITLRSVRLQQKILVVQQSDGFTQLHIDNKEMADSFDRFQHQLSVKIAEQLGLQQNAVLGELASQRNEFGSLLRLLVQRTKAMSSDPAEVQRSIKRSDSDDDRDVFALIDAEDESALRSLLVREPSAAALTTRDSRGRTPLHAAAAAGNAQMIFILLTRGVDAALNAIDIDAATPLHLAVKAGSVRAVRTLLERGADSTVKDDAHAAPAAYAPPDSELAWILSHGPGIDTRGHRGTALWHFARSGDVDAVRSLLDQGALTEPPGGWAPLRAAAKRGFDEIIGLLLDAGASPNTSGIDGRTALGQAACEGHEVVIARLIAAGCDLDPVDNEGYTPLVAAVANKHEPFAVRLVASGADVVRCGPDGSAAVHFAARLGLPLVLAAILDKAPEQANARGQDSQTPLAEAALHGHAAMVKTLLDAGADPELRGDGDASAAPIHRAAMRGQSYVVQTLVEHGADVNSRTAQGKTALLLAVERADERLAATLLSLDADAGARQWTADRLSPLDCAVRNGRLELVRMLAARNEVDVNARTAHTGITPLCRAVENSQVECAALLLSLGADVNRTDGDAQHAFNCGRPGRRVPPIAAAAAAAPDSRALLEMLIERGGADVDARDADGRTALHTAAARDDVDAVRYLLERGADRELKAGGKTAAEAVEDARTPEWRTVTRVLSLE